MKINIKDNTFRRVESRIIRCLNKCESDCTSQNERDIEIEEHTLEILDIAFNDTKNGKKLLLSLLEFITMNDVFIETKEEKEECINSFLKSDFV
jgi:hypothetical protein